MEQYSCSRREKNACELISVLPSPCTAFSLTFSLRPPDPKRFDRAEKWAKGLGKLRSGLFVCFYFSVWLLTTEIAYPLRQSKPHSAAAKRVCPLLVENVEERTLDIIKITVIILLQWADRVGARERTRRIFALCCVVPTPQHNNGGEIYNCTVSRRPQNCLRGRSCSGIFRLNRSNKGCQHENVWKINSR